MQITEEIYKYSRKYEFSLYLSELYCVWLVVNHTTSFNSTKLISYKIDNCITLGCAFNIRNNFMNLLKFSNTTGVQGAEFKSMANYLNN